MKKVNVVVTIVGLLIGACMWVLAQDDQSAADNNTIWPRVYSFNSVTLKMFQPQLDKWDGYALEAHSAIGVQKGVDETAISFGVANFTAKTIVDKESRIVKFENIHIENVKFPAEPDQETNYLAMLRNTVPTSIEGIPLDQLEVDLAILSEQKQEQSHELNNAPPKILFSTEPSMLILVDGNPVFAPLKDTSLSRVINTQVLLLKDSTGKMYLHVFDGYMEAPGLAGPWKVSNALPPEIAGLDRRNLGSVDLLEGEPDQDTKQKPSLHTQIPHIYVSVEPAELVVTDGEPNYLPIDGTNLLYVSNTTANVFKNLNDQMTYIVISGRWFRSRSGNGPWEYVAGDSLPADFAKIPDTSTKENVKATIPNTEQAQEAAIANTVPTTEKIDRNTTQLNPEIDGDPQMLPIEGTPLNYVSNCSVPIIEVGADSWYAVSNGVWFVSSGPRGAWRVAQSVPSIIYSIPVTSPLHFVTYVRIYDAHPDFVYVGYTPGYYGTILDTDGIVVYGTGYVYRSYLRRNVWYGYPVTYGYGCSLCWTPMYGWSYGYGFGWGRQNYWYHPPVPYWGPYRSGGFPGYHNPAIWRMSTSANIYHRSFGAADRGHTFGAMNPAQLGRAYNSRTGALVVGNANAAKNVFTGVSLNNRFKPGSPGVVTSAVRPPVSVKNVNTHIDNNVYGTKEGHVYHFNPTARNWQHLNPAANNHQQQHPIAYLNRAQTARSAGNNRAKNFQQKSRAGSSNKNGRQ